MRCVIIVIICLSMLSCSWFTSPETKDFITITNQTGYTIKSISFNHFLQTSTRCWPPPTFEVKQKTIQNGETAKLYITPLQLFHPLQLSSPRAFTEEGYIFSTNVSEIKLNKTTIVFLPEHINPIITIVNNTAEKIDDLRIGSITPYMDTSPRLFIQSYLDPYSNLYYNGGQLRMHLILCESIILQFRSNNNSFTSTFTSHNEDQTIKISDDDKDPITIIINSTGDSVFKLRFLYKAEWDNNYVKSHWIKKWFDYESISFPINIFLIDMGIYAATKYGYYQIGLELTDGQGNVYRKYDILFDVDQVLVFTQEDRVI